MTCAPCTHGVSTRAKKTWSVLLELQKPHWGAPLGHSAFSVEGTSLTWTGPAPSGCTRPLEVDNHRLESQRVNRFFLARVAAIHAEGAQVSLCNSSGT